MSNKHNDEKVSFLVLYTTTPETQKKVEVFIDSQTGALLLNKTVMTISEYAQLIRNLDESIDESDRVIAEAEAVLKNR